MRIEELKVDQKRKHILAIVIKPKTLPEVVAKSGLAYSTVNQILNVFAAQKYVIKHKTPAGKTFFHLNKAEIQP